MEAATAGDDEPAGGGLGDPLGADQLDPAGLAATAGMDLRLDHPAITADAFVLDETFVLRVFAAGDAEPLLVVDMPAYVPTAER
ncbi:MAG: hypothetical protein R6X22_06475 [Gemmatimonadota bacterium]